MWVCGVVDERFRELHFCSSEPTVGLRECVRVLWSRRVLQVVGAHKAAGALARPLRRSPARVQPSEATAPPPPPPAPPAAAAASTDMVTDERSVSLTIITTPAVSALAPSLLALCPPVLSACRVGSIRSFDKRHTEALRSPAPHPPLDERGGQTNKGHRASRAPCGSSVLLWIAEEPCVRVRV